MIVRSSHSHSAPHKKRHGQVPVSTLKGARFAGELEPHRCLVASPIQPGPQPCLIVVDGPAGETWWDALVIIPSGAGGYEEKDSLYRTALKVLQKIYRKIMPEDMSPFLHGICAEGTGGYAFGQAQWAEKEKSIRKAIEEMLIMSDVEEGVEDILKKRIELLERHLKRLESTHSSAWTPVVLCQGLAGQPMSSATGELSPVNIPHIDENWMILKSWKRWESQKMDARHRANEFHQQVWGASVWLKISYQSCRYVANPHLMDAFRKRCAYLGLPAIPRSKASPEEIALQTRWREKWQKAIREANGKIRWGMPLHRRIQLLREIDPELADQLEREAKVEMESLRGKKG